MEDLWGSEQELDDGCREGRENLLGMENFVLNNI